MRIRILTITHKSPLWLQLGYEEYAKRLPPAYALELVEIPAEKRTTSADLRRIAEKEGEKMLAAIHRDNRVIALDVKGKMFGTEELAKKISNWQQMGQSIDLLVGGPEGLSVACLAKADEKWSLSPLTFPHFLVRLIVAEQIYRAYTILTNHPYHR